MATDRRKAEAIGHLQQAEKCLKTSFFKWNPDFDGAVSEYIKAATCFRNAKLLSEARDAYLKAADLQEKMRSPFHAAKSYEQAGLLSKENKEIDLAVQYMERAAFMFQEHGTPDTSALCLEKAGKMVEQTHPVKAVELFMKASDVADIEDRPRQSAENMGRAARLLMRLDRYEEAMVCLKKEIQFYAAAESYAMINKLVLGGVMIQLQLGDFVAAEQFFHSAMSYPGFGDTEEAASAEQLLQAYDEGDEDAARTVLKTPLIKYMDNAFARLARDLVIPGGGMRVRKKVEDVITDGDTAPVGGAEGGAVTQLDEEELEGGLC